MTGPQTPLPLIVRKNEGAEDQQFMVECDFGRIDTENGAFIDQYFCVSGYFGTISPHVFAAAPELLEALTMSQHPAWGNMSTPDFLDWVADRLVYQYGENPSVDFVVSLRKRAFAGRAAISKATTP